MENKQSGLKGRMDDFAFEPVKTPEKKPTKTEKSPKKKS
jgi:hypothetical protein